ncbi:MAG: hypothetical protein L3K15_08810 [Thermoplasmata archaeon]|nr:hypothetical protein [Thermoplasmata archaeon]
MPDPSSPLSADERRWLHDKFERLAAEESQLASTRTTYYAAIGTVLITALVVAVADLLNLATLLAVVVTFLALLGILISLVWIVLLHRTNDAKNLWREAAARLEKELPPLAGEWSVPISLRSDETVVVNLFRPFVAHAARFSGGKAVSWIDRANPDTLTEILPMTFFAIWIVVLASIWTWFLFLR